jgi:tetratricopeptide (TPR) repeat protein
MGYCDLEKLLRLSSGYEVNQDLFESAHRNLMLAYDQGMDNDRIKASALMDLGILHQRVQNHGLATKFFGKRKPLGFTDASEEALFSWYYARSLYFINQPDRAAIELDTVDWSGANGKTIPASYRGPILERKAFYLEAAGKFADAAKTYEQVFQTHQLQGNLNLAKVYLNYGSALFKLKKIEPARQALMQTLDYAKDLPILPKSRDRAIAFEPVRIKAVAYGLLAQLGSREQRLEALAKRKGFLLDSKSLLTDWLPTIILNDLQTAFLLNTESPGKAAIKMEEALKRTEEMGASNQYLSNAVYRATVDYLVHAIRYPDIYASDPQIHSPGRIKNLVEKIIETYDKQKTVQPVLEYQKIKIQMLWATYQLKVLHHGEARELDALLNTAAFAQLKTTLNPQWNELRQLRKKL